MENRMYHVTNEQISQIKRKLHSIKGLWIGEIDGALIDTWEDYAHVIEKVMQFPTPCKSFLSYSDWITDLSWLHASGYALIIKNFNRFMSKDLEKRKIVIEDFEEDVLPWWQDEIKNCVVEGEPKPFNVYLVD